MHIARARAPELAAIAAFERLVLKKSVQVRRVRRVNAHLKGLQPVAVPQPLEGKGVGGRGAERIDGGEWRRRLAFGAEPAKQNAAALDQRVAALAHTVAQGAAGRLGWGFDALARDVKLPAMKRAAQAIAFVAAKGQVRSPVRAVAVEQTIVALRVAKQHQVLAQNAHGFHGANRHARIERGVELVHQRHRLPIVAHHRAARCARPDAGDQFVLFSFHGGLCEVRV